jgi:transcription-repair coupling factor (superfamily II helicase)
VRDGRKQVAILVPTTVLAQQHFNTFRERMADYPIRVELLSRYRTRGEQDRVVTALAAGTVDIVIGTHRLVQEDIAFKDLGLGGDRRGATLRRVAQGEVQALRTLVDVLTLSATPIPAHALPRAHRRAGHEHDRDAAAGSVAGRDHRHRIRRTHHPRRHPARDERGGQVFFLHNRVTTSTRCAEAATLVPDARIVVGHGQMNADDLEEVMTAFINGEADVLLSTTIIESGLDIPNANTIIIDRADRFGLSDLYQLAWPRGALQAPGLRLSDVAPPRARMLTDVRKRISAMKQYSTLGSGFKIAMRDLEIRGAGNLLGAEQSGHITAVGFELYCQLLKQSVGSMKGEKVKPRVEVRVALDFLLDATNLPENYAPESQHRIEIYRKLAQATDKPALDALQKEMRDRFGPIPPAVELLLAVGEIKILASERHITVVEVKEDKIMLTRNKEFITLGGKFPRLTKKDAKARLKELKKLLLAL